MESNMPPQPLTSVEPDTDGIANTSSQFARSRVAILRVSKLRSAKDAKPIIRALSALDGVDIVIPDYRSRTLAIVPKSTAVVQAAMLWAAVEKASAKPVRLTVGGMSFTERPHLCP